MLDSIQTNCETDEEQFNRVRFDFFDHFRSTAYVTYEWQTVGGLDPIQYFLTLEACFFVDNINKPNLR